MLTNRGHCWSCSHLILLSAIYFLQPVSKSQRRSETTRREHLDVQFIGFNLFTVPGGTSLACNSTVTHCYFGDNVSHDDINTRTNILIDALLRAWEQSNTMATTLKIFAAPEFFFRGASGAYNSQSWSREGSQFDLRLRAISQRNQFRHWLIVCGTIVSVERANFSEGNIFYNAAPIFFRGRSLIAFKSISARLIFWTFQSPVPSGVRTLLVATAM